MHLFQRPAVLGQNCACYSRDFTVLTVLHLNQVQVHLSQTHAVPANAAAFDAQSLKVLSALPYLSDVPSSLSRNFKTAQ